MHDIKTSFHCLHVYVTCKTKASFELMLPAVPHYVFQVAKPTTRHERERENSLSALEHEYEEERENSGRRGERIKSLRTKMEKKLEMLINKNAR